MQHAVIVVEDGTIRFAYSNKPIKLRRPYSMPGWWFAVLNVNGRLTAFITLSEGDQREQLDVTEDGVYLLTPYDSHKLECLVEPNLVRVIEAEVAQLAHKQHAPISCDIRPLSDITRPVVDNDERKEDYLTDGNWATDDPLDRRLARGTYVLHVVRRPSRVVLTDTDPPLYEPTPSNIDFIRFWVGANCSIGRLTARLLRLRIVLPKYDF